MIAEESEHQELSRESTTMDRGGRTAGGARSSVNTNDSLCFDPCEDSSPSPTGAEDGFDDGDDAVREGETEVR